MWSKNQISFFIFDYFKPKQPYTCQEITHQIWNTLANLKASNLENGKPSVMYILFRVWKINKEFFKGFFHKQNIDQNCKLDLINKSESSCLALILHIIKIYFQNSISIIIFTDFVFWEQFRLFFLDFQFYI